MYDIHGLEVTFDKTCHVIFPAAIAYVDLGSANIIAGKADGAENVIRVKAAKRGFKGETNMSVITEDGHMSVARKEVDGALQRGHPYFSWSVEALRSTGADSRSRG